MAIGLCNSIWRSTCVGERMCSLMMMGRFMSYLDVYYNPIHYRCDGLDRSYMISVSSSRNTCITLSPSHHVMTCSLIGYISGHSLTMTISVRRPYYHTHRHSYLSLCGNSSLLASLYPITPSSHCL